MSFNNIFFILNKPQLSENIGACARAMKNFNFSNLVIINPKPSFPNDKIFATSVGAKEIIQKAKVYENFEDSLSNFDYLIATSSRFRNKNLKHINLNELKKIKLNKKIGFIFGSEASGLSNNEISYANCTMNIPSNKNFKSLNLSHSLILVCQNLFNLIWFGEGRWDWNDVYHMPIFLRSYWINQCNEIREAREAAIKKQSQRRSTSLPTKPRR